MNRADQNLCDIVFHVNMITRFAIEVAREFDDDHRAVLELALRQAADEIAKEREIERRVHRLWPQSRV